MSFPFPQREVRLLGDPETEFSRSSAGTVRSEGIDLKIEKNSAQAKKERQ